MSASLDDTDEGAWPGHRPLPRSRGHAILDPAKHWADWPDPSVSPKPYCSRCQRVVCWLSRSVELRAFRLQWDCQRPPRPPAAAPSSASPRVTVTVIHFVEYHLVPLSACSRVMKSSSRSSSNFVRIQSSGSPYPPPEGRCHRVARIDAGPRTSPALTSLPPAGARLWILTLLPAGIAAEGAPGRVSAWFRLWVMKPGVRIAVLHYPRPLRNFPALERRRHAPRNDRISGRSSRDLQAGCCGCCASTPRRCPARLRWASAHAASFTSRNPVVAAWRTPKNTRHESVAAFPAVHLSGTIGASAM